MADDDVLLREDIAGLLERSGFEIAGQASDAEELLRVVHDQEPDLVIVDMRMPLRQETEGLDAAYAIRRELSGVGILVLSAHAEVAETMELLATGRGIGYVLKSRVARLDDFLDAIDRVIDGGSVVDPGIVQELAHVRHARGPARTVDRARAGGPRTAPAVSQGGRHGPRGSQCSRLSARRARRIWATLQGQTIVGLT